MLKDSPFSINFCTNNFIPKINKLKVKKYASLMETFKYG